MSTMHIILMLCVWISHNIVVSCTNHGAIRVYNSIHLTWMQHIMHFRKGDILYCHFHILFTFMYIFHQACIMVGTSIV